MTSDADLEWEEEAQKQFLTTPIGLPGSGATRYAAAMYFYEINRISVEMLEIYRTCSKFDAEDPLELAKYEGVTLPPFLCSPDLAC